MDYSTQDVSEAAARAAGEVWVVVSRLRRRLLEVDTEDDLSPAQASVLMRLDKTGPASVSELAAVERVRHQSMTKTVGALEQAGLVERNPDPEDGRRQLLSLTERGRERRQGDRHARQTWLARALQERGSDEQLAAVLTAMALLDDVAQS